MALTSINEKKNGHWAEEERKNSKEFFIINAFDWLNIFRWCLKSSREGRARETEEEERRIKTSRDEEHEEQEDEKKKVGEREY